MKLYVNVAQVWVLGLITAGLGVAAYTVISEAKSRHVPVWNLISSKVDRMFI